MPPELDERYLTAAKSIQSATQMEISFLSEKGAAASPKYLRAGLNNVFAEFAALGKLLVSKGVITWDEYYVAITTGLEDEAERCRLRVIQRCGLPENTTFN
jgi:hypothetical protein